MSSQYWFWNGQAWQPQTQWSGADRALNYGDGLFETIRFTPQGQAPLWGFHLERLAQGLAALHFPPACLMQIDTAVQALPLKLRIGAGKLLVSRGVGQRGYALPEPTQVQLLFFAFAAPSWGVERFPNGFKVGFSPIKLGHQPLLAGFKHLNRLEQVLIRQHFSADCQEMVVQDYQGNVVEGAMSNIFMLRNGQLYTPPLSQCGVNGVVRRWLCQTQNVQERRISPESLVKSEAVFFCNSLNGIVPVRVLAQRQFSQQYQGWQYILSLQQKLEALFCSNG